MPGNPNECREHAKNCLKLAEDARTPEARAHFQHLAERWMDLAHDLEVAKVLLEQWGKDPEKPAA